MRAVLYEKSNSQNQLILQEINKPMPGADEVLVKIYSTSINAADYRSVKMRIIPKNKIFGADIAGIVEACGENINRLKPGNKVFGDILSCGFGGFAEYVCVPEKYLAIIPKGISFTKASALPMASLTALQGMRDKGNIAKGMKVLVHGAGGGVGTFAVQLAKYFGAEVTALCGTGNVDLMNQLHADHVINYNFEDFSQSKKRYDLILAVHGNHSVRTYFRALTSRGIMVMMGGSLSQLFKAMLFGWIFSLGKRKIRFLAAKACVEDLEYVISLVSSGEIMPIIDRVFPLEETSEAMKYAGSSHSKGKVIIEINHDDVNYE